MLSFIRSSGHPAGFAAAQQQLGADRDGHVERAADVDAEELRRRDANDRERHAFHGQRAADRVGGAVEAALPEAVADDRDRPVRPATAAVVSFGDRSAEDGGHAQQVEHPSADPQAVDDLGLSTARQIEARARPCERAVEACSRSRICSHMDWTRLSGAPRHRGA